MSKRVQTKPVSQGAELQRAIQVLPSRSITDSLVQHFLRTVNFNYNIIYPPTFLEDYTQWWADRAARKPVSPGFTCLLIRALSNGVQYLNGPMKDSLEFELAESAPNLHEKLHQAAEALSSTFTPGEMGITQVQQLFLVVTYLKGDGRFVDSWHAMATCVREAQELDLHLDDQFMNISEYEREMRRRLWTSIYVWDWLMSKNLGRPLLADRASCTFRYPTLQLELNPEEPDSPPAFMHMKLQAELIARVDPVLSEADRWPSEKTVEALHNIVEAWSATIPPVWRWENSDTQWDAKHPNLKWQRELLAGTVAAIELLPLKPYLTGVATAADPRTQERFMQMAADACMTTIGVFSRAYAYMMQYDPKHFYINFTIFDITTLMCSAVLHDTDLKLPQRHRFLEGIALGIENLRLLSKHSKPGVTSYAFVTRLAQSLPLSRSEQVQWSFGPTKRVKTASSPTGGNKFDPQVYDGLYVSGTAPSPESSGSNSHSSASVDTQPMEPMRVPSLNDFETTDFGIIDELWDWQGLNIDLSSVGLVTEQPREVDLSFE